MARAKKKKKKKKKKTVLKLPCAFCFSGAYVIQQNSSIQFYFILFIFPKTSWMKHIECTTNFLNCYLNYFSRVSCSSKNQGFDWLKIDTIILLGGVKNKRRRRRKKHLESNTPLFHKIWDRLFYLAYLGLGLRLQPGLRVFFFFFFFIWSNGPWSYEFCKITDSNWKLCGPGMKE